MNENVYGSMSVLEFKWEYMFLSMKARGCEWKYVCLHKWKSKRGYECGCK